MRRSHRGCLLPAALGTAAFADPIGVERFVAPGAPIAAYAGVRVRF
jgi:hypothetical protein